LYDNLQRRLLDAEGDASTKKLSVNEIFALADT